MASSDRSALPRREGLNRRRGGGKAKDQSTATGLGSVLPAPKRVGDGSLASVHEHSRQQKAGTVEVDGSSDKIPKDTKKGKGRTICPPIDDQGITTKPLLHPFFNAYGYSHFCFREFGTSATSRLPSEETNGADRLEVETHKIEDEMYIPSEAFAHVIGKGGTMKAKIERETSTSLRVPRRGEQRGLVIVGFNEVDVERARTKIEVLLSELRGKLPLTHFISVPLSGPKFHSAYTAFQQRALEVLGKDGGMDNSMFQPLSRLHITCCVLKLLSEDQVQRAAEVVQDLAVQLSQDKRLNLQLKGLLYYNVKNSIFLNQTFSRS